MDVLIVEPLEPEVVQWLVERHAVRYAPDLARDPRAFRQALYNVRALILPPSVALDAPTLQYAPVLKAVGRASAGAENIDTEACAKAGVEVVRSLGASAGAEAEFIIGSLLAMLRRVPVMSPDGLLVGRELSGCTVGVVGMSPCVKPLAQLLRAFGAKVIGYDPALHASDPVFERWGVQPLGLREVMERSDGLCVQLGYYSRYRGLLGERVLPFCKNNQVVVSLTPSSIFDETMLAEVLDSGRMAACWLDSLEPGALDPGRPLHGISTLQVTPRVASTTRESRVRAAWQVARRIDELLAPPAPVAAPVPAEALDEPTGDGDFDDLALDETEDLDLELELSEADADETLGPARGRASA